MSEGWSFIVRFGLIAIGLFFVIRHVRKADKTAKEQRQEADRQRYEAQRQEADRNRHEAKLKQADRRQQEAKRRVDNIRRQAEQEKVAADELKLHLESLKSKLPFNASKKLPSFELADQDEKSWREVTRLVESKGSKKAILYFVKVISHLDGIEYHKIGMTTKSVESIFEKSTQLELLDIICVFKSELWKVAYLEYHFLREFRLYDGLAISLDEYRPEVNFSGSTGLVRSNSVIMISEFFGELGVYNEL